MSTIDGRDTLSVCANCGKGEEEIENLKSCTACMLVKYCNRECQIAHRPQHKKECRKRAAELHDKELFKQPPPEHGDCPICFLRIPSLASGRVYKTCCGKTICCGCLYAPIYDDQGNEVVEKKCAFCRAPNPASNEEVREREKKRVEANDPIAIYNRGNYYSEGLRGFPQDYNKALEHWHRAVELGNAKSNCCIGYTYHTGRGVDVDKKKANHYYEQAAMGGNAEARYNLGASEENAGNMDRALKHYMIAVRSGDSQSLDQIKQLYSNGHASKEDYTKALQLYQAYLSEIKSPQRDKAAVEHENCRYY